MSVEDKEVAENRINIVSEELPDFESKSSLSD